MPWLRTQEQNGGHCSQGSQSIKPSALLSGMPSDSTGSTPRCFCCCKPSSSQQFVLETLLYPPMFASCQPYFWNLSLKYPSAPFNQKILLSFISFNILNELALGQRQRHISTNSQVYCSKAYKITHQI